MSALPHESLSDENVPRPRALAIADVLQSYASAAHAGEAAALATVVSRHGSAPSTAGQKLLLRASGEAFGTVGGGAVEREVLRHLRAMHDSRVPCAELVHFRLGAELGMCCGGRVVVLLEALGRPYPSYVVGAGHVASALVPLLKQLGFAVLVSDSRDGYAGIADGATADAAFAVQFGEFDEVGRAADASGACLVMTHDHQLDQRAIEWALRRGFEFVGGVGSRAKAERTRARLAAKGVSAADQQRVRMPLGLECSARAPLELAVAIAGELIAVRAAARARESITTQRRQPTEVLVADAASIVPAPEP